MLVTAGITLLGNLVQRTSETLGELIGVGAGTLASGLVHAASFVLSIVVVLPLMLILGRAASLDRRPERTLGSCGRRRLGAAPRLECAGEVARGDNSGESAVRDDEAVAAGRLAQFREGVDCVLVLA